MTYSEVGTFSVTETGKRESTHTHTNKYLFLQDRNNVVSFF